MKDKKLIYIVIIMICLTVILGISYAWFNTIIEENEKDIKTYCYYWRLKTYLYWHWLIILLIMS